MLHDTNWKRGDASSIGRFAHTGHGPVVVEKPEKMENPRKGPGNSVSGGKRTKLPIKTPSIRITQQTINDMVMCLLLVLKIFVIKNTEKQIGKS